MSLEYVSREITRLLENDLKEKATALSLAISNRNTHGLCLNRKELDLRKELDSLLTKYLKSFDR